MSDIFRRCSLLNLIGIRMNKLNSAILHIYLEKKSLLRYYFPHLIYYLTLSSPGCMQRACWCRKL